MANPTRKISVQRKRKRRTHFKLALPGLVTCPECGKQTQSHRVCKSCGFYKGRTAVTVK